MLGVARGVATRISADMPGAGAAVLPAIAAGVPRGASVCADAGADAGAGPPVAAPEGRATGVSAMFVVTAATAAEGVLRCGGDGGGDCGAVTWEALPWGVPAPAAASVGCETGSAARGGGRPGFAGAAKAALLVAGAVSGAAAVPSAAPDGATGAGPAETIGAAGASCGAGTPGFGEGVGGSAGGTSTVRAPALGTACGSGMLTGRVAWGGRRAAPSASLGPGAWAVGSPEGGRGEAAAAVGRLTASAEAVVMIAGDAPLERAFASAAGASVEIGVVWLAASAGGVAARVWVKAALSARAPCAALQGKGVLPGWISGLSGEAAARVAGSTFAVRGLRSGERAGVGDGVAATAVTVVPRDGAERGIA